MTEINNTITKILEDNHWPSTIYVENLQRTELENILENTKQLYKYANLLAEKEVIVVDNKHIYNITFYSKKNNTYFEFNDQQPKVFIDVNTVDELVQLYIHQKCIAESQDIKNILTKTLNGLKLNPVNNPVVQLYNIQLDNKFIYAATRKHKEVIDKATEIDSLEEIKEFTQAFNKFIKQVGGLIWGSTPNTVLYSHTFKFRLRIPILQCYNTREEAEQQLTPRYSPQHRFVQNLVNFDKAFPYAVHAYKENLFNYILEELAESETYTRYYNTHIEVMAQVPPPQFKQIQQMVPEYDGTRKQGLWAFVKRLDTLYNTYDNPETRLIIAQVAKRNLRGNASDAVVSVDDEWPHIRAMLVSTSSSNKNVDLLKSNMSCVAQRNLDLDTYFGQVKDIMIDWLIKSTHNLDRNAYNLQEAHIREAARTAFIMGLRPEIATGLLNNVPNTLEEAFQIAKERSQYLANDSTQSLQQVFEQSQQKMLKIIDEKLQAIANNSNSSNHQARQNNINNNNTNNNRHINQKNNRKYCQFHNTNTHWTSECRALKQGHREQPVGQNQNNGPTYNNNQHQQPTYNYQHDQYNQQGHNQWKTQVHTVAPYTYSNQQVPYQNQQPANYQIPPPNYQMQQPMHHQTGNSHLNYQHMGSNHPFMHQKW